MLCFDFSFVILNKFFFLFSQGILLVFDFSRRGTLDSIQSWIYLIKEVIYLSNPLAASQEQDSSKMVSHGQILLTNLMPVN